MQDSVPESDWPPSSLGRVGTLLGMFRAHVHAWFVSGAILLAVSGCAPDKGAEIASAPIDSSAVGTGNTIGFRISREAARQVLSECDSVAGDAVFAGGTNRRFIFPADSVLDLDGMIRLPGIPARDCRIELVFTDRRGTARLRLSLQVTVGASPADTGVAVVVPETPVTGAPFVVLPVGDASWDPGIAYNLGAGSGLMMLDTQSLAVIDFGRIDSLLAGREILRARLLLQGWSSSQAPARIRVAAGTIPRGWQEGDGHWYWWDGVRRNGYDVAYQYWPGYRPPASTSNPTSAGGIRADRNPSLGAQWQGVDTILWEGTLTSTPVYPARDVLSPAEFDLTPAVKSMIRDGNSQAIAIRALDDMGNGLMQFLSKEHQDGRGDILGPRLVVEIAPESTSGELEFRPLGDTWIDSSDRNTGLGSGVMLWRNGDMALFDFGNIPSALAGRGEVASAKLILTGWSGVKGRADGSEGLDIEYGTIPLGWLEGRGHWYWFDGAGRNGFDSAYRYWPDYLPPVSAVSPSLDGGVHWSTAVPIRAGFQMAGRFAPTLALGPDGIYPAREASTTIELDVTEAVREQAATGQAKGFALRRLVASNSPRMMVGFFSKDMAPDVAPVLRVRFAR